MMSAHPLHPRTLLPLLLVCLLLLASATSRAQTPADVEAARRLFKEATELAREGNWLDAREKLKRSIKLKPAPITHYSLGVAQKNTGELVEALENFRVFLNSPPHDSIDRFREPARAAVAELDKRVARVVVKVAPAQLEALDVRIDGVVLPPAGLDLPRIVNPGEHEVKAVAEGYLPANKSFEVGEGGSAEVALELSPAPVPAVPEDSFPILPVSLIGGGAVVLGVGLAVGLTAISKGADAPSSDGEEADAALSQAVAGDVLSGVGIAAAGVGGVLLLLHLLDDEPPTTESRARLWSYGDVAGVAVSF
jgi:hypothetical protein